MTIAEQRASAIEAALADIRAIEASQGVTRASIDKIKHRVIALASRSELFPVEHFPRPASGEATNACLYRVSEDADHRYALYVNSSVGAFETPVHNHTTWAVVAGISGGTEVSRVYAREGNQAPVKIGEEAVRPGTAVAFMPDEFHAIAIDAPLLNFHVYGMGLEQLHAREYYRESEAAWAVFPPHSDIREPVQA